MSEETKKDWEKFRQENELEAEFLEDADQSEVEHEAEQADSAGAGALDHPSYRELEDKLTLAEQKAHENWEKSVRALAELDNIRRRAERDVSNAHRYGLERFANALLPVVDSLEQALQIAEQQAQSDMKEGLVLTMKLFLDVLQKFEVEQLDPKGEPFDPQYHEAMSMQESDEVAANSVLAVFQKGYKLNDRVIRPARVIVAK